MIDKVPLREALESVGMSIHEFETYQIAGNAPRVTALGGEAVVDDVGFQLWVFAIRAETNST